MVTYMNPTCGFRLADGPLSPYQALDWAVTICSEAGSIRQIQNPLWAETGVRKEISSVRKGITGDTIEWHLLKA